MMPSLDRIAFFCGLCFLTVAAVFAINQTAQVVSLASTLSPMFGRIVLLGLLAFYAVLVLVPLVIVVRLPKTIQPPRDSQSPEFESYLRVLRARLKQNPHLAASGLTLTDRAGLDAAFKLLGDKADDVIKKTASSVFLSTAISQSGRLDGLMVLAAQTRMIWQIALIYHERPSVREMLRLYGNVGATILVASQIQDLDLSEQVRPVLRAALGSVASVVPGLGIASSIVAQSILEGTANAYLTLRVGVISKSACSSLTAFDRNGALRFASVTAASLLGAIVRASAATVAKAVLTAGKKATMATVDRLNPFRSAEPAD